MCNLQCALTNFTGNLITIYIYIYILYGIRNENQDFAVLIYKTNQNI